MWPNSPGQTRGRGQLAGLLRASLPRGLIPFGGQGEAVVFRFPLPPIPSTSSRAARSSALRIHPERFSPA